MFPDFKNSSLTDRETELGLIKWMFAGWPLRSICVGLFRKLIDSQTGSQDDSNHQEQVRTNPWHKEIRKPSRYIHTASYSVVSLCDCLISSKPGRGGALSSAWDVFSSSWACLNDLV